MLTANRLRQLLHYDKKTGLMTWIAKPKYHTRMLGKIVGHPKNGGANKKYIWVKVDGGAYSLSRLAFLWVMGRWPKEHIDHKNGNSLDNRWCNLREATKTQNSWNHKSRRKSSGLPMGIRRLPNGSFQARIAKHKTTFSLGAFKELSQATAAYTRKRKELFGEFA